MERREPAVLNAHEAYISSRLADYTLRIANATSRQNRKKLEREKEEFERKHGVKTANNI
jgi:hypothetical protein